MCHYIRRPYWSAKIAKAKKACSFSLNHSQFIACLIGIIKASLSQHLFYRICTFLCALAVGFRLPWKLLEGHFLLLRALFETSPTLQRITTTKTIPPTPVLPKLRERERERAKEDTQEKTCIQKKGTLMERQRQRLS